MTYMRFVLTGEDGHGIACGLENENRSGDDELQRGAAYLLLGTVDGPDGTGIS